MNLPSELVDDTIRYYDRHADEYVKRTVGLDTELLYASFLKLVPQGGRILDAGCGSGRDAKAFRERGYDVAAIDASKEMAARAGRVIGQRVEAIRFQEMEFHDEFEGIWACASILHVPRPSLRDVIHRFSQALRLDGVLYVSFKKGWADRVDQGRLFTDMNEQGFRQLVVNEPLRLEVDPWYTDDLLPERHHQWFNVLLRKV